MKTEIYMVRHAHSTHNIETEATRPLSKQGFEDADQITEILKKEKINVVVSSSYVRAIQTVQGIADVLGTEVKLDARFRERDLAAKDYKIEDTETAMKMCFDTPDFAHPGGETNNEVQKRGVEAFNEVIDTYKGKKIAIGIHGHIMTIIMNHYDDKYDYEFFKKTTKPDIYKMTFIDQKLMDVERLWE